MKIMRTLAVLSFLFFLASANAEETKELEVNGIKITETVITTNINYEFGFFNKETVTVKLYGVLWTPTGFQQPYPILIWNHGSQDGGTIFQFGPDRALFSFFLKQGFAVFYPLRKGFGRKEYPAPVYKADETEPIQCGNYASAEAGVKSAISDVKGFRTVLADRKDLDMTHVILMGQSRGGFLSLALAADGFPGLVAVINFSGGWFSENCYGGYNSSKFSEFGKKIKVPVTSLYGDSDRYYGVSHIKSNLSNLDGKNNLSYSHIFEGEGHSSMLSKQNKWDEPIQKTINQVKSKKE